MAKELPFFKFEPAGWIFGRIQRQSDRVKATFIDLLCKYWHNIGLMSLDDAKLDFGDDEIDTLISKKIITVDEDLMIHVKFLDDQLQEIQKTSKQNSQNGKKSAQLRKERKEAAKNNDGSTTVQDNSTTVQPISTDKIRQEETRKENTSFFSEEQREKLIDDLTNADQWKISVIRSVKHSHKKELSSDLLDKYIEVFVDHAISVNEADKSWKQIQGHFKNWIVHQLEKNPKDMKKGRFQIANETADDVKSQLKQMRGNGK